MYATLLRATLIFLTLVIYCQPQNMLAADEVIIPQADAKIDLGDFRCSSYPDQSTIGLGILNSSNVGEVSAGELWQFFNNQGISSLDRLTLSLDVNELEGESAFDLQAIELRIEDPLLEGQLLTHVSLGNNSLIVPAHQTSAFKPEAKLEIMLGYDFMKRFSADSKEKINLDYSSTSGLDTQASFAIEGDGNFFSKANSILLVAFVGFWVVVFFVLNRVTKPFEIENEQPANDDKISEQLPAAPKLAILANEEKRALSA